MPTHWESRAEPIPGYRLIERIGRGGFGEVWKAEAPGGLIKAIKFVHGEISGRDGHHAAQELKALERVRSIRHPFILSTERFDVINGQLLIVMEIADCSLEQRLREHQNQGLPGIPRSELLGYMSESAEALDFMSREYDLQHLDIKPQNIFLIAGHVKVADFGLVKDLEGCTASVTGGVTPVYAPPETFDGWLSRNSDQYSLAIVYQELLTGKRPFNGPSARQYMMQHLTADPELSSLPACDRSAVRRALSKDPKERFSNCREFVDAIRTAGNSAHSTTSLVGTDTVSLPSAEATISTQLNATPRDSSNECKTAVRPRQILDRASMKTSGEGTLRPTLVIGLGELGLDTLERIRQKLTTQFGDSGSHPLIRLLGIDLESALSRPKSGAMPRETFEQLVLCRYRKPNQYFQSWNDQKHLSSWLDPNLMLQISPTGGTNGHRALGRLAFFENYRRILSRLRAEIEILSDPARLQAAMTVMGRGMRADDPRVCIVASMGGGLGSGMFLDLCHVTRQALLEAGQSSPDVHGYLVTAYRAGKTASDVRRVNTFSLAQNILDFTQPDSSFSVDYEGNGNIHHFTGPPCSAIYYFDAEADSVPEPRIEAIEDAIADLAIHTASSVVGKQLDQEERELRWPRHRSIGIFSLTYPQRQLLRVTGARICHTLVEKWLKPLPRLEGDGVAAHAAHLMGSCGFDPNDIASSLLEACNRRLSEPIHVLAARIVADAEESLQSSPTKDKWDVFQEAMDELKELLGLDPDETTANFESLPRFEEALTTATNDLAVEMLKPLFDAIHAMLDQPGARLERARRTWEGFSVHLLQKFDQTQEAIRTEIQRVCRRARQLRERITQTPGGMTKGFPDSAARRVEMLEQYVEEKIACRLRQQVAQVYLVLRGKLADWSRDFVRLRQTIERLQVTLESESKISSMVDQDYSTQTVFPGGFLKIEEACGYLHAQVEAIASQELDGWIQSSTISSLGGLWSLCNKGEEFEKGLPNLFLAAASQWLHEGLAETDVAQALFDRHQQESSLAQELATFAEWAMPSVLYRAPTHEIDPSPAIQSSVVSIPRGAAGDELARLVEEQIPGRFQVLRDGDQTVFCRVQAHASLARMLPKWVLDSKPLFEAARTTRLSPEIFPVLQPALSK